MFKQHKPGCMANLACLVYHADGICPGPYGKCTCDSLPEEKPVEVSHIDITKGDHTTNGVSSLTSQ